MLMLAFRHCNYHGPGCLFQDMFPHWASFSALHFLQSVCSLTSTDMNDGSKISINVPSRNKVSLGITPHLFGRRRDRLWPEMCQFFSLKLSSVSPLTNVERQSRTVVSVTWRVLWKCNKFKREKCKVTGLLSTRPHSEPHPERWGDVQLLWAAEQQCEPQHGHK